MTQSTHLIIETGIHGRDLHACEEREERLFVMALRARNTEDCFTD